MVGAIAMLIEIITTQGIIMTESHTQIAADLTALTHLEEL